MHKLTLIESGCDERKINFCRFKTRANKEIKVTITAECFVRLRTAVHCDNLEVVCRCAAEHALSKGEVEDVIDVVDYYRAVEKELRARRDI